jgi:adenylate cyclase
MADEGFKRKLTAILNADAVEYSRLMGEDEEATVSTLTAYREVFYTLIQQHNGQVLDSPGDNLLAEFASVVDAVKCAVSVQKEIKARNNELPENRRMQFRIGINLGDVIQEKGRIYGDGVNIAARLEGLSEPGGICVSRTTYDQIKNKLGLGYEYLGEHRVKNIHEPVQVYRVLTEPEAAGKLIGEKRFLGRFSRRTALAAIIALVIVAGGLIGWNIYLHQSKKIESASEERMAYPLPDKPSFAVLPFTNMSGDPDQEYFSDGFTDTIIGALSRLPNLFVIARTSSFYYKDKPVTVKQVSQELGVQNIVEGSIQKSGDQLRVTVQLIDALTGGHIWSERYDQNMKDIFKVQDEIVFKIIKSIGQKYDTVSAWPSTLSARTSNLDAYLKNLKAANLYYMGKLSAENYKEVKQLCQEAIALDPNYVSPYCLLTYIYQREWKYGFSDSREKSLEQALNMAKKAVELDESSSDAYAVLGKINYNLKKYDESITALNKAINLNPNNADAYVLKGALLCWSGRAEEAIPYFKKALQVNPKYFGGIFTIGLAYILLGKYDEAIPYYKETIEYIPGYWRLYVDLAACYAALGMEEESKAQVQKVLNAVPDFSVEKYIKRLPVRNPDDIKYFTEALHKAPFPDSNK